MSILALSNATGIAYSTLQPHVSRGKDLSLPTARKLAAFSKDAMTVAEILGLGKGSEPVITEPSDTRKGSGKRKQRPHVRPSPSRSQADPPPTSSRRPPITGNKKRARPIRTATASTSRSRRAAA